MLCPTPYRTHSDAFPCAARKPRVPAAATAHSMCVCPPLPPRACSGHAGRGRRARPQRVPRLVPQHDGLAALGRLDALGCVRRQRRPIPGRLFDRLHGRRVHEGARARRHVAVARAGADGPARHAARHESRVAPPPGLGRPAAARAAAAQAAAPVGPAADGRGDDRPRR
eukprot:4320665-Prymnesium_polylepis.1